MRGLELLYLLFLLWRGMNEHSGKVNGKTIAQDRFAEETQCLEMSPRTVRLAKVGLGPSHKRRLTQRKGQKEIKKEREEERKKEMERKSDKERIKVIE